MCLVDQQVFGGHDRASLEVIAEPIGEGLQHGERRDIGLVLARIGAAGTERHRDVDAARLRCLLHAHTACQHDEVGQRDLLAVSGLQVEFHLDAFECLQHLRQLIGSVDRPVLLRRQADTRAVRAAALVAAAERRRRRPRRGDQLGHGQSRGRHLALQRSDVGRIDGCVVGIGQRVLPDQFFLGHFRTQVARARAHVAMGQLEPRPRERIGERLRILQEALGDRPVDRIEAQRQVGGQHLGALLAGGVVRERHVLRRVLGDPLVGAGRRLLQLPFEPEQVLEELVAPQRGRLRPGDLDARGDGVAALAAAEPVVPAQALLFQFARFRFGPHVVGGAGTMRLAEGMASGDEGDGFLVVHRHAGEGVADVLRREQGIGIAVGAFRVHVDQTHLHGRQRILQPARMHVAVRRVVRDQHTFVAGLLDALGAVRIADVAAQPRGLAAPVHVLVRFPGVLTPTAEAESAEAHRFQRDVAGQDHQVGPRDGLPVFLLDRPQQAARLVQADVVGPAVERREALLSAAAAAAPVADAVGACAMPGHADEKAAVVAEIGRPPVLRIGHQVAQVLLQRVVVDLLERLGVVEAGVERVGARRVLVQQVQAQLVGPPVAIAGTATRSRMERALGFSGHGGAS